jgi:hypothetical protein
MVEMDGIHQALWFVMLEYAKEQVLEVDPPGQQLPPPVRFGTACLLIRADKGCESSLAVWGKAHNVI